MAGGRGGAGLVAEVRLLRRPPGGSRSATSGLADLHTHSARSDGLLEPARLVREAAEAGLACVALTDHDTLAGVAEASEAASAVGLELIPGVELSVREDDPGSGRSWDEHLVGLFVDPSSPGLVAYLTRLQEGRQQMVADTLAILAGLGMPLDAERVAELAKGAVVTRPHVARAMVERRYVRHEREAFELWLGNGRPAAPQRAAPGPAEGIAAILGAGGVASLAHPVFPRDAEWKQRLEELPARLDRLAELGLAAVECDYPDATPAIREQIYTWTTERGLLATGGSDYHGPGKSPEAPLGECAVSLATVEALRRLAARESR